MKKKVILLPFVGLLFCLVLSGYRSGPGLVGGIEGTGASGLPGCSCHNATATPAIAVTIQLLSGGSPVTYYFGGDSYTVRISGLQTSSALSLPKFGFQLAAVKSLTSIGVGAFTAITGTHLSTISTITLAEQSAAMTGVGGGGMGTTYTVDIPWTAPPAGTGLVSIHGVINAVNGNGMAESGDKWNVNDIELPERRRVGPITGLTTLCEGATSTLSDSVTGGTWTSSAPGTASITLTGGLLTGVAAGTAIITYDASLSGVATTTVTVLPAPGVISGVSSICDGATATFTNPVSGGMWSSSNPTVATIGVTSGLATAVAPGVTILTYRLPSVCYTTHTLTVNPAPDAGTLSGAPSVCVGFNTTLTSSSLGGTWSASNAFATVGSLSGLVTGVALGLDTITYTVTTACGTASATRTIEVVNAMMCSTGAGAVAQIAGSEIIISPNPSKGLVTLELSTPTNESAQIVITNLFGQVVKEFNVYTNQRNEVLLLNQPAGIYYISATAGGRNFYTKVLLQ